MFADIVGYSRLIEADEEATLATIASLRAQVLDPLFGFGNERDLVADAGQRRLGCPEDDLDLVEGGRWSSSQ